MTRDHDIGNEVVLRVRGTIEGAITIDEEVRAYHVRLELGDLLGLTPEQLAAATDTEWAIGLLLRHLLTGEPISVDERDAVVAAGLAPAIDFNMVGGDLFQHVLLRDEE
jgi:hypothetical protein